MDEEVWNHAVFSKNRERLLLQLLALHSRQHYHSPQLTAADRCSPQCGLFPRPSIKGHFNRGEKGTLSSRYNTRGEFPLTSLVFPLIYAGSFLRASPNNLMDENYPASAGG